MGKYAKAVIATEIVVKKERRFFNHNRDTTDEVLKELEKIIDPDLYYVEENDDYVVLKLQLKVLRQNIKSFVLEQFELIGKKTKIKESAEKILTLFEQDAFKIENLDDYIYEHENEYVGFNYFDGSGFNRRYLSDLTLSFEGIMYLYEGKVSMEDFSDFSTYLHHLIRAYSKNPLKDTVILDFD